MQWVLIVMTFYLPHVPVAITEVVMQTGAQCFETRDRLNARWDNLDPNFGGTARCERRLVEKEVKIR